jgi:hypothetical protein
MLSKNIFRVTLPAADSATKNRNFLISVDGRSSNRNIPVDREYCDISMGMGSFVFLRVTDRDGAGSMWVYETDFVLFPEEPIPPERGFKVEFLE